MKCRKRCTLFKVKKDFTLMNQNLLWYQKVSINIFKSVKIHSDGWEILRKPSVHGLRFTRYWTVCFLQLLKWFTSMVLPEIFIGINTPGFLGFFVCHICLICTSIGTSIKSVFQFQHNYRTSTRSNCLPNTRTFSLNCFTPQYYYNSCLL